MKSVYSAVRTGSLNRAVCAWSVKGYKVVARNMPDITAEKTLNLQQYKISSGQNMYHRPLECDRVLAYHLTFDPQIRPNSLKKYMKCDL